VPSATTQQTPLATLLSHALVAFTFTAVVSPPEPLPDEAVLASPAFAEGIEPPPTGWRSGPPYAAQTDRLLTDPRAALPRHPLMLHRGGHPDGA